MGDKQVSLDAGVLNRLIKLEMLGILDFVESRLYNGRYDIEIRVTKEENTLDLSWLDNCVGNIYVKFECGGEFEDVIFPITDGKLEVVGKDLVFGRFEIRGSRGVCLERLYDSEFTGDIIVSKTDTVRIGGCIFKDAKIKIYEGYLFIIENSKGSIDLIEINIDCVKYKKYKSNIAIEECFIDTLGEVAICVGDKRIVIDKYWKGEIEDFRCSINCEYGRVEVINENYTNDTFRCDNGDNKEQCALVRTIKEGKLLVDSSIDKMVLLNKEIEIWFGHSEFDCGSFVLSEFKSEFLAENIDSPRVTIIFYSDSITLEKDVELVYGCGEDEWITVEGFITKIIDRHSDNISRLETIRLEFLNRARSVCSVNEYKYDRNKRGTDRISKIRSYYK